MAEPSPQQFSRAEFMSHGAEHTLLNRGRFGNADVYLYSRPDGQWVVKDFRKCAWPLRLLWSRHMVRKEFRALQRLGGLPGIPGDAFLLDADAVCCRFLPGLPLCDADPTRLDSAYFRSLERLVWKMHRRGVAHLDLRYRRNILLLEDGSPALIDFQSHVLLDRLPRSLQKFLRVVDYSGVYKHWCKRAPASIGTARIGIVSRSNRRRNWWILRGYSMGFKKRGWREYEKTARMAAENNKP